MVVYNAPRPGHRGPLGGRPWPQGGTISWLICIYIYECIIIYEWFWMRDLLQLLLPLAFQCHVKGHLQYEFPRFWDMYMSSDSSILTPGQLPDWQISKGFNRYERLKLLRCLWMHPTTLAELSLCAPWLYTVGIVSSSQHGRGLVNWCLWGVPIGTVTARARCKKGPVAHNHQGLHQWGCWGFTSWWILMDIGGSWCQCHGKWISPPSTNMGLSENRVYSQL